MLKWKGGEAKLFKLVSYLNHIHSSICLIQQKMLVYASITVILMVEKIDDMKLTYQFCYQKFKASPPNLCLNYRIRHF